jgi:hypothetical protein
MKIKFFLEKLDAKEQRYKGTERKSVSGDQKIRRQDNRKSEFQDLLAK